MSKQWMVVLGVIAGLAAGAYALVRFGPENTGVEIGKKAPDFRLVDVATGDSVSLRALAKGDVALINIWATWCEPCKEEMPAMQRAYADLAPRGFRILAVSIDNGGAAPVKAFTQRDGHHVRRPAGPERQHPAALPDDGRAGELPARPRRHDREAGHRRA